MSHSSLPTPLATLDVTQVVRAVEEFLQRHRPDLAKQIKAHNIVISDRGRFVWELHEQQLNGLVITEITTHAKVA